MKINHYLKNKAIKEKQLKLDYKIFNDLYLFFSKVFGKNQSKYYVNTLNFLFKVNSNVKLVDILNSLKLAINEDKRLYTTEGMELKKLITSANKKSYDNIRSLLQIKEAKSKIKRPEITNDLNNIIFKIEFYQEYKIEYSEIDYQKIILIIDLVIREDKQNKFNHNILKAISRLAELTDFNIIELKRLKDNIEVWTTGVYMVKSKAKLGGWAYVIDMNRLNSTEIIGYDAFSNTTKYEQSLIALKKGIEYTLKLGFRDLILYTDSELVFQVYYKWMHIWEKNSWLKKDGKEPKYLEQVKSLYNLFLDNEHRITLKLEKNYKKVPISIKATNLAIYGIKNKQIELDNTEKGNPHDL